VLGWVKNLEDTRVEVVAEAEEENLHRFLEEVNQHFSRYNQEANTEWLPASGAFRDFRIRP
jgi:acylphosphatase